MPIMTAVRAAFAVALATTLYALPAHAQRVFVSGTGSDSNPCTFAAPCRTFAQAFATAPVNGEIDVLEPAGYGALTITHGISIQGHGFSGITQATGGGSAITINSTTSDPITLSGLVLDGAGTGLVGIEVNSGSSVQILNCVIRHFSGYGIAFEPISGPSNLLVSDTVTSDAYDGILLDPSPSVSAMVTLSRITANNNSNAGVKTMAGSPNVMITESALSNNNDGLDALAGTAWLEKSAISGNATGVAVNGGTVNSYGDNAINGNTTNISGTVTKISGD